MASGPIEMLRSNEEKLRLVLYLLVIVVLSLPITLMAGHAYQRAILMDYMLRLRLLIGLNLVEVASAVFGIFLGLLLLMTLDRKKRWQAFLLWLGLGVALFALVQMDLFLANMDLSPVPSLVGIAFGLFVGGIRDIFSNENIATMEFRNASRGIFVFLVVVVVFSLFENHVTYPDLLRITQDGVELLTVSSLDFGVETEGLLQNVLVSAIFLVTLRRFIQYDAEKGFFVLGPPASGKSLFLIGAYLEALRKADEETRAPLDPSDDLMSMIEHLDRPNNRWIVEATGQGQVEDLRFQYVHGDVFPKNVRLSTLDYAGEYLSQLPDVLTDTVMEENTDQVAQRLASAVRAADTLILVVDVERFVDDAQNLDINPYYGILEAVGDKDVILLATKADLLAERFQEERGLEAHRYYDDFREFVNNQLRQSKTVDSLVLQTGGGEIIPVYYQTTENEHGERVPMRDDANQVMTVGFDYLLDRIGGG